MIHPVLSEARAAAFRKAAVGCALVAAAVGVVLGGCSTAPEGEPPPPPDPSVLLADDHLETTPPRVETGLELTRMGWRYDCVECHRHLPARWHQPQALVEHRDLKLEHGNNRFCLNCHHPENRDAFVDYDGSEIPKEDVTLLCGKCHGPIYRDWKDGLHGRRTGTWLASGDDAPGWVALRCIQCHDPHQPAFPPIAPMSPPTYPERAAGALALHADRAVPFVTGKEAVDEH